MYMLQVAFYELSIKDFKTFKTVVMWRINFEKNADLHEKIVNAKVSI